MGFEQLDQLSEIGEWSRAWSAKSFTRFNSGRSLHKASRFFNQVPLWSLWRRGPLLAAENCEAKSISMAEPQMMLH